MISSEKISELIKYPSLVESVSVVHIAEIKEKFAYCSSLHLLYLKALAVNNDVQFETHLRFAAAHVMDRERMYNLIHSGEENQSTSIENSTSKIQNSKESQTLSKETLKQIQSLGKKSEEKKEPKIASEKEIIKSTETIIPTVTSKEDNLLIEATILPTIVDVIFEKELNALPDKQIEKFASKSEEKKIKEQTTEKQESNQSTSKKSVQIESKPEIDLSKLSFVEWLKYKQGQPSQTVVTTKKKESIASQKTESEAKTESSSSVINLKNESANSDQANVKSSSKSRVDALLNKFISEEPSISKPKSEFFSPIKTAKQSLEESPDLVTETLAKIYVLQKNYSKAIQAYEQLILVYPEKKTFFVSQIEKIKGEQH